MLVISWILAIYTDMKIGTYLNNISGTFVRNCTEYLMAKLHAFGTAHHCHIAHAIILQYFWVRLLIQDHIWDLVKANSGGYFYACTSLLAKLDHAQNRFLHELDLTRIQDFLEYNFAPRGLRRNIGKLGLLHKRVLGKSQPNFEKTLSEPAIPSSCTVTGGRYPRTEPCTREQSSRLWTIISVVLRKQSTL